MAHFAEVQSGIVQRVLVVDNSVLGDPEDEQAGIDFLTNLLPGSGDWVQTSYRTVGNQHPDGTPLRGNYAGVGYTWTGVAFHAPQPYPSWTLSSDWLWEPPTAMPGAPEDWRWDEASTSWVEASE